MMATTVHNFAVVIIIVILITVQQYTPITVHHAALIFTSGGLLAGHPARALAITPRLKMLNYWFVLLYCTVLYSTVPCTVCTL